MAKVKITGHASGTGVVTITAPNTSTDRTITLPDGTGTLLDENSSLPAANLTGTVADARISALTASKLTGDLPAISGVNVTNVHAVNSGKKNWIINGDFSIWQRYGVAGAAQPNASYVADRWKGNNYTSGTYTFAQRTDATGQTFTTYGRLHQSVAGSTNSRQGLDQYIEGTYLVGKTITVSFKARANAALAGCQVRGIFTSTQTFNLTTDWVKYSFTATAISSGSTARLMVDYGFSNAVWYADIAEFQVEVGSVATDFEKRSYGEELHLCQRYYEIIAKPTAADDSPYFGIGHGVKTDQINWYYDFKAEKRAPFTLIVNTVTNGYYGKNHSSSFNKNTLGVTMGHQSLHSIMGYMTNISGVAEQSTWTMQCNGAGCLIAVSAEL